MKSKTLFFDAAALKKNITRFAPAWVLYGIFLLMVLMLLAGNELGFRLAENISYSLQPMAVINLCYGLLCAQLLFGDLYNSRMCNALHALPLRREGWFLTHVVSGILFALVPNTVVSLIAMALAGSLWQVPLLWLAVSMLQYLFFFGVAVLSAYLVGNRFAMALVYLIFNFFSLIAYWLVTTLYEPLLYGVTVENQIFLTLCPVARICQSGYMQVDYHIINGIPQDLCLQFYDGWGYLAVCAAIGLGAMGLALILYRKRHLEFAGDFMAVKQLMPVFLVLYTLCAGACCHGFFDLFLGSGSLLYLLLGLSIGFFTGLMLLNRTVRVFQKKRILGFAVFVVIFLLTLLCCRLDLLGIVRWVPKAEQVESVHISTGAMYYYMDNGIRLTEESEISDILSVHRHGLNNRDDGSNGKQDVRLFLNYTMRNGMVRSRVYYIDTDTEAGKLLLSYFSRPEAVLHGAYTQQGMLIQAQLYDPGVLVTDPAALERLMEAMIHDCNAGNLAQDWNFYPDESRHYMYLSFALPNGLDCYLDISFHEGCTQIMEWCEAQNIEFEK